MWNLDKLQVFPLAFRRRANRVPKLASFGFQAVGEPTLLDAGRIRKAIDQSCLLLASVSGECNLTL